MKNWKTLLLGAGMMLGLMVLVGAATANDGNDVQRYELVNGSYTVDAWRGSKQLIAPSRRSGNRASAQERTMFLLDTQTGDVFRYYVYEDTDQPRGRVELWVKAGKRAETPD